MQSNDSAIIEVPAGTDYKADASRNFWSSIQWRTLYCLIENQGARPISELARSANLSVNDTVLALESMELIGLIRKTPTGYEQTSHFVRRYVDGQRTHFDVIEDFLLSSSQVNNHMLATITDETHKTKSLIYNSSRRLVDELLQNIQNAIDDFKKKSDASPSDWDGVYALSSALVKMTKDIQ